ncbi:putative polysaccharide biosynthesis protein [Natranaerobius trueperi]|uniref:Polysaccharide biosynthesis protein n=1 Tax=Natranaerobius trueperi TaxID=759412 RepID=A0A226C1K0_9FIRM|nr:polysaccharide biosynthesis protein [Natranaerobius trueperi]OWZ84912.1 polysaccharide biosynthesis protein [Natranaerobius trueperi]
MMAEGLFRGAFVLMIAGILSKLMGALYRIPLSRIIGAEGMGLYEMAYPIYSLLLIMAVSGVPIAVSKMVSEQLATEKNQESYRVFIVALLFLLITGSFFSWLMYYLAEPISFQVLGDPRVVYSLRAISPAILIVSLMAAFRGYFQGMKLMTPTAISQVIEQFVRVTTMLILAYILIDRGVSYGAAGATFGAVTGALGGLFAVILLMFFYRKRHFFSFRGLFKALLSTVNLYKSLPLIGRLLTIAIPVSLGALVIPIMQTIDAIIIPQRLQFAGFEEAEATHLYGLLSGMALRLVSIPSTFSLALGTTLVPALSESNVLAGKRRVNYQLLKALRLNFILVIPAAIGLFIMAPRLTLLLFDYKEAGEPLRYLAFGTIFLSLQQVTAYALQGLGLTPYPVKNLCYGALINILINYHLTAIPEINIIGGAIGTCSGFFVASVFNIRDLRRHGKVGMGLVSIIKKPIFASVLMGGIIYYFQPIIDNIIAHTNISTIFGVCLGMMSYCAIMIGIRGITDKDLESIPKIGPQLSNVVLKIRWWSS